MDFFNFLLYIFLNSTISFCSTFYLLQPFFFYLNFHINFLLFPFHLSSISSKLSMTKKVILSLSLFDFVSLLVDFFFFWLQPPFFSSTNGSFCYCWFNCHITFLSLFGKFVSASCIFRCFGNPIPSHTFFFFISLIWFYLD